jgi:ubiquinone/menaquinone biosynthesis C-methylase UbiE
MIICSEVLEHLPDDARALREMSRVLFKHGAMIITVALYEDLDLGKMHGHLRSYIINSFLKLCSVKKLEVKRYLLACKTIHAIRKTALNLFGR